MIFSKSKKRRGCVFKRDTKWEAQVGLWGKANYVGRFKTKKLAQEAIDKFLMHHEA